jgi:hypothetical protein
VKRQISSFLRSNRSHVSQICSYPNCTPEQDPRKNFKLRGQPNHFQRVVPVCNHRSACHIFGYLVTDWLRVYFSAARAACPSNVTILVVYDESLRAESLAVELDPKNLMRLPMTCRPLWKHRDTFHLWNALNRSLTEPRVPKNQCRIHTLLE